jgi:hypothetical protein
VTRPAAAQTLSVAELQEEIGRTRARLSRGLAVLDREYALRHLLVRGTRLVRETELRPGAVAAKLRHEILPLALVGVGLAWLVLGRKEGGDLLRRLADGLAHLQSLAKELFAWSTKGRAAAAPDLAEVPEQSGEAAPRS